MNQEEKWLLNEKYDGMESEAFHADCDRLHNGEPLGYVIGSIPFLNCNIYLDNQPLIPRTETEYWVEKAIAEIQTFRGQTPKCLDLCAGSGCIGVAVAKAVLEMKSAVIVDFAEIDPALLPTIKKNLTENIPFDWNTKHSQVMQSDLFTCISGKYDFVLTNPPYIDPVIDRAETSVKKHEPHLALYGGTSGIEIIERIITDAPTYLNPHGQLWIEHEPEQSIKIQKLASQNGFNAATHKDQYLNDRYSILVLK